MTDTWANLVAGRAPEIRPLRQGPRRVEPPFERWVLEWVSRAPAAGGATTTAVMYRLPAYLGRAPMVVLVAPALLEALGAGLRRQGCQVALLALPEADMARMVVDAHDLARYLRYKGMARVGLVGVGPAAPAAAAAAQILGLTHLGLEGAAAQAALRGRVPAELASFATAIPAVPPPESGKQAG